MDTQNNAPNFDDLEAKQAALEAALNDSLTPQQRKALESVRMMDSKRLESDRKKADEAIAARVAEILAGKLNSAPVVYGSGLGNPARIVGHNTLMCRDCGRVFDADHENPHSTGCGGNKLKSHDFFGLDTVITEVPKLEAHHAVYIDGTVCHPAS